MHLTAKPVGGDCNLRCAYCYYRDRPPGLMSREVLHHYLRRVAADPDPVVAWQGGEPTLAGLEFYRTAALIAADLPGRPAHTIQTNGTLLDGAWCRFLRDHDYLVGLSLDGPRDWHDPWRSGSWGPAVRGLRLLQDHGVQHSVLTVLHAGSRGDPDELYDCLLGLGVRRVQLIPAVGVQADWYGRLLVRLWDRWCSGEGLAVANFEQLVLATEGVHSTCVTAPVCEPWVLEWDGSVWACDLVPVRLGNLLRDDWGELVRARSRFGAAKRATLPAACRRCEFLRLCWGDCPRHRAGPGPGGLCAGMRRLFRHVFGG